MTAYLDDRAVRRGHDAAAMSGGMKGHSDLFRHARTCRGHSRREGIASIKDGADWDKGVRKKFAS
ncbi:MAG: hypothetical protein BroJett024_26600 [Alphaproteobacteria bacterium]|nr:MAG: hypothetical protein BroJett024_26600 [Alphaproteobacteria bacterium]